MCIIVSLVTLDKHNCFIVMSKKDYYLYVYEKRSSDTVLVARYDCCFALRKGNKTKQGDMRTPHCTLQAPFSIQEIVPAHSWMHDFGDGRGSIRSYGDYFLRLFTPGHKGIGIHGSTNNRESVPGRASEGCIRLKDEDIKDLAEHYAFSGMKVIIKAEQVDDYPFEIHAFKRQHIERKRHFDPAKTLTNEQIETAQPEQGRSLPSAQPVASQPSVQPAQGVKTVVVKGNDVRLRLGPGTSFGFLANADGHAFLLRNGESLPCAGEIADWYKVKYQGIRPAAGYPSLPDQRVIFIIDRIMPLSEIGIALTENGAMSPASSVSGIMISHPSSRYFIV